METNDIMRAASVALALSLAAQCAFSAERPLARTRLAICEPLHQQSEVARPVMPVEWFRTEAEKCGCTLAVLSYREATDGAVLNTNNFDTFILPAAAIPFECEDTAFRFLQQGGSVITRTVIPSTYRITADCRTEDEFIQKHGAHRFREHSYGWYAPFLIRQNPSPQGRRDLKGPIPLAPGAADIAAGLLPASLAPETLGKVGYRLLNRWEQVRGLDGGYGDPANYALAADCAFDPYVDADGMGTDFCVYRYRNAKIFGATLVQIGNVGTKLLQGPKGGDAFKAMLKFLEADLPGDRGVDYGRLAVKVHLDWSELCFAYFDAVGKLRDAAAFEYENGGDWKGLVKRLGDVERLYTGLLARRSEQKALLRADKEPEKARAAGESLVRDMAAASSEFAARAEEAESILKSACMPARKPVRNRMGTVVSISSSIMPMSLGRARGDCFDVIRRIGSNVTSTHPLGTWFTEDPAVQEKLRDFWRDFKFVYASCPAFAIGGDRINPANGTVKKYKDLSFDEDAVRKQISTWVQDFAFLGTNRFYRIGTGDETGMSYSAWGESAERKFRGWLAKRYGDVAAMNRAAGLSFASFDELKAPLRQPKTQAEHAVWQLWRLFREEWLRDFHRIFTRIVKEVCPTLQTFQVPSTGAYQSPVFCLNAYELLSDVDQSGIDGTCCSDDYEWQYADICPQGRFMTAEWGGLYQEAPFQNLYGKLWQEMAAGSWGAEQHRWSYGHDACNYADHLDVPTRYGAMLWAWLRDVRRYDPVLMDGSRADPEVTILYSHTSRLHDQNWGWAGEKIFSPHMFAVASYYGFFLDYGRSARVVDEMALVKGPLPQAAVMVVPQARYLEPEVQRALIEYARRGGRLVLEGRVGEFDGFGRKSDWLFRQTFILPFNGPEPKTVACGKGSVTFTAADRGLQKSADFQAATERLLRSLGVSERFVVSDPSRMLREWVYDGETYLILASNEGKSGEDWGIGEVEVAVRGDVEAEDWLTGARLKTSRADGYTAFKTLAVNGARVFRVASGKIAPANDKAALARKPRFAEKAAGAASDVADVTLPFSGKIYDTTSLRCGDTVFAHTTVSSGYRPDDGESYLTMRAPGVESRKRIEPGKTYHYRSRSRVFRVTCERVFQMYPFFSNVKIEEVAAVPDGAAATAEKTCEGVRMTNGLVELEFDPTKGGGLKSMKLADERVEQVRDGRSFAVVDSLPGPFRDHALRAEAASDAKGATLVQTLDGSSRGYSFAQRATLAADAAEIGFGFTIGNRDKVVKKFSFNYHPELALGSAADSADSFVVPLADGSVRSVQWRGGAGAIRFEKPDGPWMAVVDAAERLALVMEFDPAKLKEVYCYDAPSFYTVEPTSPMMELPVGRDYDFGFSWLFFRGLTGVDSVAGRFAAHLAAPDVWNQSRPFAATLQVSTANRGMCAVSAAVRLLKGGSAAAEASADGPGGVAFDLPSSIAVGGDFSRLPDGEYELAVDVSAAGGEKMSFRRPLRLAGGWFARISAFIEGRAKEIDALAQSAPPSRVFDLQLRLKALEEAVAANRLDEAERLMREFSDVVVSAEGPGFTNALERVSDGRWSGGGVEVCMSTDGVVKVSSPAKALERIRVGFPRTFASGTKFFKDAWERTGGDSGWRAEADFDFSPWYTMAYGPGGEFAGFGVQVRPNSLVAWRRTADGLEATLDVSSGGRPVRLGGRTLVAAKFVFMEGRRVASAFEGARAFAAMMCPSPRLAKAPVYGYNDWYCAYGSNTATNFLADAAFVCSLAEGLSNRPYVVMDDGWQKNSPPVVKAYNANGAGGSGYGPWDESGERFGMAMAPFAAAVRRLGARPGLWYRPYRAWPGADASLRSSTRKGFFDPTIPEVRRMVFEDVRRFREWGFELVKIDYLTFDLCGLYGAQMGDRVFHGDCGWRDDTRTSAEVVNELHDVMREAAGDGVVIIGCNALNHLVAGLFELQRTGEDTSGWKWEQTRQKGVNTLAARGFQDRIFFAVDADCAGLAREGAVDWSKNRQWIDLLGRSGTPFFISWKRDLATPEVVAALKSAFALAAEQQEVAEPLDWMANAFPCVWRMKDGVHVYDWE